MAAPQTKYYACTEFDAAGQCTSAAWLDAPMVIPPLSVQDGSVIGMKMFAAIVIVYCMRKLFDQAN